jgi:protein SCO1
MSKKTVFYTIFFGLLGIAFLAYSGYVIKGEQGDFFGREKLPVLGTNGHTVGGFSFTNQEGRTITSKDVEGKVYVAEYFFTTCTGICPKMNRNLEKVYAKYKDDPKFRILSHTVDPETDSVPVLKRYALDHGADPKNWWFLTGSKKELYKLARAGYMVDDGTYAGDEDFVHTQWVALVDGEGRIRGLYEATKLTDIDKLNTDIGRLLKED